MKEKQKVTKWWKAKDCEGLANQTEKEASTSQVEIHNEVNEEVSQSDNTWSVMKANWKNKGKVVATVVNPKTLANTPYQNSFDTLRIWMIL